jgi:hypothetical protein
MLSKLDPLVYFRHVCLHTYIHTGKHALKLHKLCHSGRTANYWKIDFHVRHLLSTVQDHWLSNSYRSCLQPAVDGVGDQEQRRSAGCNVPDNTLRSFLWSFLVKLFRKLSHIDLSKRASSQDKVRRKNCRLIWNGVAKSGPCFPVVVKKATDLPFSTCIRTKTMLFGN